MKFSTKILYLSPCFSHFASKSDFKRSCYVGCPLQNVWSSVWIVCMLIEVNLNAKTYYYNEMMAWNLMILRWLHSEDLFV